MGDNRPSNPGAGVTSAYLEKRKEERFGVPPVCQPYITLEVKADGKKIPALLANFSRSGILFEAPLPFETGQQTECTLSASFVLARDISFKIAVKYCYKDSNSYIIGASIDTISDESWFDCFVEIHDYICTR
jgi:hypothetical protein